MRGFGVSLLFGAALTLGCKRDGAESSSRQPEAPNASAPVPAPTRGAAEAHGLPIHELRLPPGYQVDVYAAKVKGARSMALSDKGTLFVGTRKQGKVYAIPNADRDAFGDRVLEIAKDLHQPNGVAFRAGTLFVAEVSRILRFDAIEPRLDDPPEPVALGAKLPSDDHHGWKFIAIGPDDKLYVPVGAPCNVCLREEPVYASITRMNLDGSEHEVFARGVRNSVGFDWHPITKALWFTDNGRDLMGDDTPPDELDVAPEPGLDFGFPRCHGRAVVDPEHGKPDSCQRSRPPAAELGAHVAALGMRFYTGDMFPKEMRDRVLIAEHGSWNRSEKVGYRITTLRVEGERALDYRPLVTGWLQGEKAWGRPVDVLVMPDGSVLVSDDEAGAIYRISYSPP